MSKVFGYPKFDENGEMILTTYENDYKAMMMVIVLLANVLLSVGTSGIPDVPKSDARAVWNRVT